MASAPDIVRKAKKRGDKLYREGFYKPAASEYSICIQNTSNHDADLIIYHSNRCACYLQLNRLQDALDDANACISINPRWMKGYQRLGRCYERLQRYPEAIAAYEQALELEPRNHDIREAINFCRQFLNGSSSSSSSRPNPMPSFHWQRFGHELWQNISRLAQQGVGNVVLWWSSLRQEMKWLYGGCIVVLGYLWMNRTRRVGFSSSSNYHDSSYDYYYDNYPSGGLSVTALAIILAAGKLIL
jgi:tetratricopeptide (TPR) repeat protein